MFGLDNHLLALRGNIGEAKIELDKRLAKARADNADQVRGAPD
jgi:hypothetical protein